MLFMQVWVTFFWEGELHPRVISMLLLILPFSEWGYQFYIENYWVYHSQYSIQIFVLNWCHQFEFWASHSLLPKNLCSYSNTQWRSCEHLDRISASILSWFVAYYYARWGCLPSHCKLWALPHQVKISRLKEDYELMVLLIIHAFWL